jgi:hypothetical protein
VSDQRVRLDAAAVQWRAIDDQLLMFDVRRARYLHANRSATVLWPLLERGATVGQLAEHLAAVASIEQERARRDVLVLVEWLRDGGLLIGDG